MMENNLPEGWVECNLGEILNAKKGKKPKSVIYEPKNGYIPYILIDEMEGKPIRTYTNDPKVSIIDESEVLLVWDGSIGKCGSGISGAIGSTLVGLKALDGIQTKFLEYTIKQQNNFIKETSTGTGLQHINKDFFEICKIPLPPLPEQHRIVAKLDALMQKVESNRQRLDKIPKLLKRFRQSVLAAAVSGRLTEDWRIKNRDTQNVDIHLRNYVSLRIKEFETQLIKAKKDALTRPSKPNFLEYSIEQDCIKSPLVPDTWLISKIGLLCDCIVPGRDKPRSFTGDIPWVTLPEICTNVLDKNTGKLRLSLTEISEVNAKIIPIESVVMCCVGRFGISAIVKDPIVINQQLHAFLKSDIITPKYLMYHLKTMEDYQKSIATSTTIAYLNKTNCNSLPINLPPIEEQKEIVLRVDQLFALADRIEARYTKAKAMLDKLPQTILAKAFRGGLVPQDANDEPASVLLERIALSKLNTKKGGQRKN